LLRNVNIGDDGLWRPVSGLYGAIAGSVLNTIGVSSCSGSVKLNTKPRRHGDMTSPAPIYGDGGLGCFGSRHDPSRAAAKRTLTLAPRWPGALCLNGPSLPG